MRVRAERCGRRTRLETGRRELCRRFSAGGRMAVQTDSGAASVSSTMRAAVGTMRSCGFMVRDEQKTSERQFGRAGVIN